MSQEDLTTNAYYTKFKGLWDELLEYETCSCGHQAEECVMSFLMSLNDTYIAVRGQILLMDPIPSLSKVFSLLVQDEKQRKVGKNSTTEASALAVKNNGSFVKGSNKGKSGRPQCTHCGALAMLLINVTNYKAIHLATSLRTRGSKVDILLLPVMLLPLNAAMKKVSISLN